MHELSLARALLRLTQEHCPPGAVVQRVHVTAGPLQAIVPEAMQLAWQAATAGTELSDAKLCLKLMPWQLTCPACQCYWEAASLHAACPSCAAQGTPVGGDELLLEYLETSEPMPIPEPAFSETAATE